MNLDYLIRKILKEEFESRDERIPALKGKLIYEDEYGSTELINEAKYKG